MTWLDELGKDIKSLVVQYCKDETKLTAEELDYLAAWMLLHDEYAYKIAYKKATPAQRIKMREETNKLMKTASDKAKARKKALRMFVHQMIITILNAASAALLAEIER